MRIALIDPFYDTSHRHWGEGLRAHSQHQIEIYSNKANHWKWQMVGGTMQIAQRISGEIEKFDLLLVTDMLDLTCFKGYLPDYRLPPAVLYFHENQITYPWSDSDRDINLERDHHYGFMNVRSALSADKVVFNSQYHRRSFLERLPQFCQQFPDFPSTVIFENIDERSHVLPIGLELKEYMPVDEKEKNPVFLWNHRWEYDKNPNLFFEILFELKKNAIDFQLIVVGKSYNKEPSIFRKAQEELKENTIHWGYVESRKSYCELLKKANMTLVTGYQDFFGISVIESIASGCYPILPSRLAYPEHIPENFHKSVLYDNDEEIISKLNKIINKGSYRNTDEFTSYIQKYDWSKVISEYDALFDSFIR
jgi:glycosyltransferase involved in cell wall biosynthesis